MVHGKQLLFKDLMYLMRGKRAIKSIQFYMDQYRDECIMSNRRVYGPEMKLDQYVKIINLDKIFGLQLFLSAMYLLSIAHS